MFVSRKRLDDLDLKIATLEAELALLKERTKNKTVLQVLKYRPMVAEAMWPAMYADFELKDVVRRITDHLGLEIKYVPGSDPGFTLEKKEPARKAK
jgi:hypothetical protein